ncbi:MAG: ABC transporter substrate-binding protein, partial [Nocardioides sp.]|nr:ABC transporter substrate-binding protein [Nocardioides sp.]
QAIASLDHGVSVQVVVSNDWAKAHNIDASQPLKQRMEGLPGAKDAAISSTGVAVLKLLLSQNGVSPDSVDYVTVGSDAAGAAALGHGTLQTFVGSPPSTYFMSRNANSTILASASEVPELRDMAYDILITDPGYAQKNPKAATAVATALARAENLMATDPQKVLDIEAKHFPSYSKDDLLKSLGAVQWTKDGMFTQPMWDDAVKASQEMGQLEGSVDASQDGLWTNKYLDTGKMTAAGGAS